MSSSKYNIYSEIVRLEEATVHSGWQPQIVHAATAQGTLGVM